MYQKVCAYTKVFEWFWHEWPDLFYVLYKSVCYLKRSMLFLALFCNSFIKFYDLFFIVKFIESIQKNHECCDQTLFEISLSAIKHYLKSPCHTSNDAIQ